MLMTKREYSVRKGTDNFFKKIENSQTWDAFPKKLENRLEMKSITYRE